jgi:hypothetical protein
MGYFIVEAVLCWFGVLALLLGQVPLTRRRTVRGSAARLVGIILMIPLLPYLWACKQSHVSPFGAEPHSLDPLKPETEGFVRLAGLMAAVGECSGGSRPGHRDLGIAPPLRRSLVYVDPQFPVRQRAAECANAKRTF